MSDLISRKKALDAFGLSEKTRKYGGDHSGYETRMLYEIQDELESLPTEGEWIPCWDRLPEYRQQCLVCKNGIIAIDTYIGRGGHFNWKTFVQDYDAWMPLPRPYGEKEDLKL